MNENVQTALDRYTAAHKRMADFNRAMLGDGRRMIPADELMEFRRLEDIAEQLLEELQREAQSSG